MPIGDFEPETDAKTLTRNFALYAMDTFSFHERWTLTASGRYNDARVAIRDQSGTSPALDGDHEFRRFNPALGLNVQPEPPGSPRTRATTRACARRPRWS